MGRLMFLGTMRRRLRLLRRQERRYYWGGIARGRRFFISRGTSGPIRLFPGGPTLLIFIDRPEMRLLNGTTIRYMPSAVGILIPCIYLAYALVLGDRVSVFRNYARILGYPKSMHL